MLRRLLAALVVAALVGTIAAPAVLARDGKVGKGNRDDSNLVQRLGLPVVTEAEEAALAERLRRVHQARADAEGPVPAAIPLAAGDTRVSYQWWATGRLIQTDSESSWMSGLIWNVGLTLITRNWRTAGQVFASVATAIGGAIVDRDREGSVFLFKSYQYRDKHGQVLTRARRWKTYFASSSRATFWHELASFVDERTDASAGKLVNHNTAGEDEVEWREAPHWHDDGAIEDLAFEAWKHGLPPQRERGY